MRIVFLSLAVLGQFITPARSQTNDLLWFYTEGCYRCREVSELVAKVEMKYGGRLRIERLEITVPDNYRRLMACEAQHKITTSVPMEALSMIRSSWGMRRY